MEIIEKPLTTEKFTALASKAVRTGTKGNKNGRPDTRSSRTISQFAFIVNPNANKIQIKQAVESLYNVTVVAVNTMKYSGKVKTRNTKSGIIVGKGKTYKKAVVTLKDGETINFYSNV